MIQIRLGKYRHWKGKMYEVTGFSTLCTGEKLVNLVHYKSLDDGLCWSRTVEDFTSTVENNQLRFLLMEPLDAPYDLLIETIKTCKKIWDQCVENDPGWLSNGNGGALKYVVGDKIAFAKSIRLIDKAKAEELLTEVNAWGK